MSDYIPMDLMPEILKWLPVKSLARLRCVHRSWNHLITSASFIADHLACSSMKPRLLLGYDNDEPPKHKELMAQRYFLLDSEMLEVNAKTLISSFEMLTASGLYVLTRGVVGSVNGVLCLTDGRFNPGIVLWNPLIRKYIPLPRDKLSFEDWGRDELLGFGVNESEDDFRVIRVSYIRVYEQPDEETYALWDISIVDEFFMVEVCSARDRIWRALNADILENCHMLENNQLPQCLVNGVVHWIVRVHAVGCPSTKTLLFFDFEKEVLGYLALPEKLANTYCLNSQVRRFRGMLGVLTYDRTRLGIWAMSEYGDVSSWSFIINVYTICLARELKESVLGLTDGGQILISEGDDDDPYSDNLLFLYNPVNGARRQLHFEENITSIHAPDFVESLVFMDNESGAVSPPAIQFNAVIPASP